MAVLIAFAAVTIRWPANDAISAAIRSHEGRSEPGRVTMTFPKTLRKLRALPSLLRQQEWSESQNSKIDEKHSASMVLALYIGRLSCDLLSSIGDGCIT